MSQTAIEMFETFGIVILCIVVGIMALAIFFSILSRLNRFFAKPNTLSVEGIPKENTWATVYMFGSEIFDRVCFYRFHKH